MNKITSERIAEITFAQREAKRKEGVARLVAAMNAKKESK
jgi:hypothetical protein